MTIFLVEHVLPGMTEEHLALAQRALLESCRQFTDRGEQVRYLRTISVPAWSRCYSVFQGQRDVVRRVADSAQVPFTWIEEVTRVTGR